MKKDQLTKINNDPLTSKMYRRVNRFDLAFIGGVKKLIEKEELSQEIRFCATEELFTILKTSYTNTGHKSTRGKYYIHYD